MEINNKFLPEQERMQNQLLRVKNDREKLQCPEATAFYLWTRIIMMVIGHACSDLKDEGRTYGLQWHDFRSRV